MVLLQTTEKSGSVFIRTDQLDGETDWKLRKAIGFTQKVSPGASLINIDGEIVANAPNNLIYDFKGYFESSAASPSTGMKTSIQEQPLEESGESNNAYREALSLENTMWANTVLASSGYCLGMIVYTGIETRAQMNSKQPLTKVGKLDLEINRMSKFLFLFMVLLSLGIVALSGFKGNYLINFFRFVLLLCAIIPISLRVNLDLGKVYYCFGIYGDKEIPGTIPRNSTIPEELGRVQFLLTDKTGTLTQNDMIFKKLNMEYAAFDLDNLMDLKQMLLENCEQKKDAGPMSDMVPAALTSAEDPFGSVQITESAGTFREGESPEPSQSKKKKRRGGARRDQGAVVRDTITALALCHNVTPTFPNPDNKDIVEYQASSPDEIALVKFATSCQMRLVERDQNKIVIKNAADVEESYETLANFPFSSDTKRMGIVLRHTNSGRILFYLKGAEVVLRDKVKPKVRTVVDESCQNLAREGLRTLVIAQKLLSQEFYDSWL